MSAARCSLNVKHAALKRGQPTQSLGPRPMQAWRVGRSPPPGDPGRERTRWRERGAMDSKMTYLPTYLLTYVEGFVFASRLLTPDSTTNKLFHTMRKVDASLF